MIILRAARLYDWPDIEAMLEDGEAPSVGKIARTAACYVAEDGGIFVGFAIAERVLDAAALTAIGVLQGWRRMGLGSALADRLLDELSEDRVAWAYASTPTATVPFFEQLGFEGERSQLVPGELLRRLRNRRSSDLLMSRRLRS